MTVLEEGLRLVAPPFDDVDWVVTNPPFSEMHRFVQCALTVAKRGVAVLGRLQMLETVTRYETIFKPWDGHWTVAPFVERLPMEEGCVAPDTSTATAYAWLVIDKIQPRSKQVVLIPPCRSVLERPEDYDPPELIAYVRALKEERKKARARAQATAAHLESAA